MTFTQPWFLAYSIGSGSAPATPGQIFSSYTTWWHAARLTVSLYRLPVSRYRLPARPPAKHEAMLSLSIRTDFDLYAR